MLEIPRDEPSITTRAERQRARLEDHHARTDATTALKLAAGGRAQAEALSGIVRGKPFTYWIPDIDQLKREGRYLESLDLAWECMEAAERHLLFQDFPPPGWYPKIAIICRKLGFYEREVEVLERAIAKAGPQWDLTGLRKRLARAGELSAGAPSGVS
jgi:hypothetical protein